MNTGKFKRLTLSFVGASALLVAFGVGTSAAKPRAVAKVNQETTQVVLPPQATNFGVLDASATCEKGTTLVGGGATFAAGTPLATDIELFKSFPFEDSWNARFNNNEAVAQSAAVSAICLKNKLKVKGAAGKARAITKVSDDVQPLQLPAQTTNNGVGEANASCPDNRVLVGGGASFASTVPSLRVQLFESGAQGNSWHVRYDSDDATVSQPASVFALCLKERLRVKGAVGKAKARSKVQQVSQNVVVPADAPPITGREAVAEFDVQCPNRTNVVGGGSVFPSGTALPTTALELYESGPRGNGWHVRYNNDTAVAQSVTVQALCLRSQFKVK